MASEDLHCGLCGHRFGRRADVWLLDSQWQRRFPDMEGRAACARCMTKHYWRCDEECAFEGDRHFDSWHHVEMWGTLAAAQFHLARLSEGPS